MDTVFFVSKPHTQEAIATPETILAIGDIVAVFACLAVMRLIASFTIHDIKTLPTIRYKRAVHTGITIDSVVAVVSITSRSYSDTHETIFAISYVVVVVAIFALKDN